MSALSNEEFAAQVMALANPTEPFRPTATYDRDGDCIEFLVSAVPFYAQRIDDLVTVYYSQETHQIVGSLIKGVARFCREFSRLCPGFRIVIKSGRVRLDHIFLAHLWSTSESGALRTQIYEELIEAANKTEVEGGEWCLA